MITDELIIYKNCQYQDILDDVVILFEDVTAWETKKTAAEKASYVAGITAEKTSLAISVLNRLVSISSDFGFAGNLWRCFLTHALLTNENVFTKGTELRGNIGGSLSTLAFHDMVIFRKLFAYDLRKIDVMLGLSVFSIICDYDRGRSYGHVYSRRIRDRIVELSDRLSNCASDNTFFELVVAFYKETGVGKFGLNEGFRLEEGEDGIKIVPITQMIHVKLSDLVGYEIQKQKLKENTEAFIKGKAANNCLLFGDAGTGKSTSIKAIANKYYRDGLRVIEIYKHQFKYLNDVLSQIKDRHYKFIIYMDDLSFEENETEYKYLKALIEGGLEKRPDNVLIYATSNRRHLVKETFKDKKDFDEELHSNDTVQEKLSLSARFGVTIYFGKPEKKEFDEIVRVLATKNKIDLDVDSLLLEANKWELTHGGMSGRCATQFIDYMLGKAGK